MKIYTIIPARGGSKGVPKKNILPLGGHPLIAYSIAASKMSKRIERTIVSTDAQEIADVSRRYGAEIPFMRPAEFATDRSGDAEVMAHALQWFKNHEGTVPDMIIQLRPTTPLRDPAQIDKAIEQLLASSSATALRSAHELSEPPHKMFQLTPDGFFEGFFPDDPRPEYFNLPRQMLPKAYHPNGYVDIIKSALFLKSGSLYGSKISGFITPFTIEVDNKEDFERLEFKINKEKDLVNSYLNKDI